MPTVANGDESRLGHRQGPRREPGARDQIQRPRRLGRDDAPARLSEPRRDGELRARPSPASEIDGTRPGHHGLSPEGPPQRTASASTKYQELGPLFRAFGRIGWNDGKNESFAYTEVDNTFEIGGDVRGTRWRRPRRSRGPGVRQQRHLQRARRIPAAGRVGFILGDGPGCNSADAARLPAPPAATSTTRARRSSSSTTTSTSGAAPSSAEDVQLIANPGYNSARGPVWVLSLRGHLEF